MAKKITHVSDVTGKDIKELVQIHINRPGYAMKIGNDLHIGDVVLDVEATELKEALDNITFVPNVLPDLNVLMEGPVMAKATFFRPGDNITKDEVIIEPKAPKGTPESLDYVEHP